MKRIFNVSIIFSLIMFFSSCTVEPPVLDDSSQIAVEEVEEKGMPALTYNKGVIDDFKGDVSGWWTDNNLLTRDKKGDTLVMKAKTVGPKYTPFGKEFSMIDMHDAPVLKVRMRAEGTTAPLVGISLKDVNTYDTNFDRPKNKVKVSKEYSDYYFNYNEKWKQGWPSPAKVDETMIREILFFINPGGAEWTGTLYIDEIKAIRESDMPKVETQAGGYIDDFVEEIYSWWSGSDKVALERVNETLTVTCTDVGPGYETFGKGFNAINFASGTNIIRIKAKAEGASGELRIDLKDKSGVTSNGAPVINTIEVTPELKNYFYSYEGKYIQSWPEAGKVNPEAITDILMFVNAGGKPAPYTGKLFIKEIEVIDEKKMNELKNQ